MECLRHYFIVALIVFFPNARSVIQLKLAGSIHLTTKVCLCYDVEHAKAVLLSWIWNRQFEHGDLHFSMIVLKFTHDLFSLKHLKNETLFCFFWLIRIVYKYCMLFKTLTSGLIIAFY